VVIVELSTDKKMHCGTFRKKWGSDRQCGRHSYNVDSCPLTKLDSGPHTAEGAAVNWHLKAYDINNKGMTDHSATTSWGLWQAKYSTHSIVWLRLSMLIFIYANSWRQTAHILSCSICDSCKKWKLPCIDETISCRGRCVRWPNAPWWAPPK